MYVTAIHTLQRNPKASPPVVYPGQVVNLDGDELAYVLGVPAARAATDAEITAAGFKVSSKAAEKAAAADAAAKEAAEKEAAEKAAADAAAKEAAEKEAAEKSSKKGGSKNVDEDALV